MQLKPGTRLHSATDTTQVVVVKAPGTDLDLRCGGQPMRPAGADGPTTAIEPGFDTGTLVGKRSADDDVGLEVLCTTAGGASLSIGDTPLEVKGAKPLPSSD